MMTIGETQVMVDWNKMHCQKKKKKYKLPFCGTAKESVVNMFVVYRNITFNIQVNDYKSAVIIRYQLMVLIVLWQYARILKQTLTHTTFLKMKNTSFGGGEFLKGPIFPFYKNVWV